MYIKGEPPTCAVPLCQALLGIHPSVALSNDKVISLVATSDSGRCPKNLRAFEKARSKLFIRASRLLCVISLPLHP